MTQKGPVLGLLVLGSEGIPRPPQHYYVLKEFTPLFIQICLCVVRKKFRSEENENHDTKNHYGSHDPTMRQLTGQERHRFE